MGGCRHVFEQDQALDQLVFMAAVVEFDVPGGQAGGGEREFFFRLQEEGFHALQQGMRWRGNAWKRLITLRHFRHPIQGGAQFVAVGLGEFLPEPVRDFIPEEASKIGFIRVAVVMETDEAVDI